MGRGDESLFSGAMGSGWSTEGVIVAGSSAAVAIFATPSWTSAATRMVCLTEYTAASILSPASRSMLVKRPSFSLAVSERVLKSIGLGGIISPSKPLSRASSS